MYRTGLATNGFPVQYNAGIIEGTRGDYQQQHRQRAVINLKPEFSNNIFPRQQSYGIRNFNNQQQNSANYQLKQSYSSTTNNSNNTPQTQREHFHTTTTTLKSSSKDPSNQQQKYSMDYRNGPNSLPPSAVSNGAFTRRHTAAGAHEFSHPQQQHSITPQHIPTYGVEHLASFAVGKLFGLVSPTILSLSPVPMLFTLHPDRVAVLEENGALVEEFPLNLVTDPSAHISTDTSDLFNNVLLFVVREHDVPNKSGGVVPTEMHIFQCIGVSAQEVAEDLHHYTRGHFHKVRPGRRGGASNSAFGAPRYAPYHASGPIERGTGYPNGVQLNRDDLSGESDSTEFFEMDVVSNPIYIYYFSLSQNTLNRCFDDIERFVVRIQSAAIAQRELELQQRSNNKKKGRKKSDTKLAQQNSILQLRAQIPSYGEFTEIFRKFKLCFNLLAKLKNHIHEPSAPELLHFLFTPLTVILDACQWGLGQQVAQQVYSPLLSLETCELLRNYLFPKEMDVWNALGKAWNTAPEDWVGHLPPPYRPLFLDGFAPYGHPSQTGGPQHPNWDSISNGPPMSYPQHPLRYGGSVPAPIHRGVSAPIPSREFHPAAANGGGSYFASPQSPPIARNNDNSVSLANLAVKLNSVRVNDEIELARINLEKERLEFERRKVLDKERQLLEQEQRLRDEAERLDEERRQLHRESEKRSIAESDRPDFYRGIPSMHASPRLDRHSGSIQILPNENNRQHHQQNLGPTPPPSNPGNTTFDGSSNINISSGSPRLSNANSMQLLEQNSPRQKAFLDELSRRGSKIVQVTYDRNACNSKVLNDSRNWWECRNVHSRSGFVPHTILSLLAFEDWDQQSDEIDDSLNARNVSDNNRPNHNHHPQHKQRIQRYSTPGSAATGPSHSSSSNSSTPDLIRQRTGPKGEFRYF
uniref:SH3 domain-containing protein n=1 Tax=Meloidogyne hapla TaxID=6305 RepID=A0A1I8BDL4_MELHA